MSQFDAFFITKHRSNGQPDSSFATNGIFKDSFAHRVLLHDLIVYPDGSILAAGGTGNLPYHPFLMKLKPNGSYDSTFGVNGRLLFTNHTANLYITHVILLPDNKIIAGLNWYDCNTNYDVGLARFLPKGTLDGGFGVNGMSIVSIPAHYELLMGLERSNDGSLFIASKQYDAYDQSHGLHIKFNANGSLATAFGNNGLVETNLSIPNTFLELTDLKIQADGKIVTCGFTIENTGSPFSTENHVLVIRHNANGTLDAGFGTNGVVISDIYLGEEFATCLALQPDGKILVGGGTAEPFPYFQSYAAIVRYQENGLYDSTFHQDGILYANVSNTEANSVNDIHFTADGGILITGGCYEDNVTGFLNGYYAKYSSGVPLGLDETDHDFLGCSVFPNPCRDVLHIQNPLTIELNNNLITLDGQHYHVPRTNQGLDVSALATGMYFLEFVGKNKRKVVPFQVVK